MAPGEVLFEKGEPGRLMYVVKTGDLQILDGNYVYETVSAGGIVGEMAMVDGSPRSATVCAIKRSTVIPIDERRFLFMVQQTPFFALRVMRVMTARPTPQVKGPLEAWPLHCERRFKPMKVPGSVGAAR